jgi:hypothetical protein
MVLPVDRKNLSSQNWTGVLILSHRGHIILFVYRRVIYTLPDVPFIAFDEVVVATKKNQNCRPDVWIPAEP